MAAKKSIKEKINEVLSQGLEAKISLYEKLLKRAKSKTGKALTATELRIMRAIEAEIDETANGGKTKDSPVLLSMDDAADYMGVSRRTISYHLKKGNFRQNKDGTFNKALIDKYLEKQGGRRRAKTKKADWRDEEGAEPTVAEQLERAKLRKEVAAAKRNEILVAELQGRLAPWSEIEKQWCERVAVVTAGLDSLAERLPPLLAGKKPGEMREIIRRETDELRRSYARRGKYCPTE